MGACLLPDMWEFEDRGTEPIDIASAGAVEDLERSPGASTESDLRWEVQFLTRHDYRSPFFNPRRTVTEQALWHDDLVQGIYVQAAPFVRSRSDGMLQHFFEHDISNRRKLQKRFGGAPHGGF